MPQMIKNVSLRQRFFKNFKKIEDIAKWRLPKERENDSLRHSTFDFLENCLPQESVFEILRHNLMILSSSYH